MAMFSLEHSRLAYRADFTLYACAILALAAALVLGQSTTPGWELPAFVLTGLAAWTLIEYALHRFVLHGVRPFSAWHAEHHKRPTALIYTPTIVSATLIAGLVFLPTYVFGGFARACAMTLGVVSGDLLYAIAHHATHHWHTDNAWVRRRQRWHALHHGASRRPGNYGVTSGLWDRVFGSGPL